MEHDNLFIQILEILSIKHTEDFTIRYYERHPHKNNLFGLSEMLRYYNIENVAAEIQKTQENLSSLDVPFVAYVDHEFVLGLSCLCKVIESVKKIIFNKHPRTLKCYIYIYPMTHMFLQLKK